MAVARHALTWRSKGQRSRSDSCENPHGLMAASGHCVTAASVGLHAVWLLRFLVYIEIKQEFSCLAETMAGTELLTHDTMLWVLLDDTVSSVVCCRYTLRCTMTDDWGKVQLAFDLEVVKVTVNKVMLTGVCRKRLKGDAWHYKKLCEDILRVAGGSTNDDPATWDLTLNRPTWCPQNNCNNMPLTLLAALIIIHSVQ